MRRSAVYKNHDSLLHNLGVIALCYIWILSYLSIVCYWLDQILIITPGSANSEFWRKKQTKRKNKNNTRKKTSKIFRLCFLLNEECPKLLISLGVDHWRRKTIPLRYSLGKKRILQQLEIYLVITQRPILLIPDIQWCPWAGVRYLSFSIDTAPECILWKKSREDRSLRASRDGHSSSSSILPTLLVFRHLLQVQRAAVLWTFFTWLIWSFE